MSETFPNSRRTFPVRASYLRRSSGEALSSRWHSIGWPGPEQQNLSGSCGCRCPGTDGVPLSRPRDAWPPEANHDAVAGLHQIWKRYARSKSMNEIENHIRKLEEELTQTEHRLDVEALDRIYADDIMVTAPIGICVDKPMVMDEVRRAAAHAVIGRYDKDDLKLRAYG